MANAERDENNVPTLLAVSTADGTTPITVYADPTTHRLKVQGSGAGNVSGPVSSTDNAIARWDGTSGQVIQDSKVVINDSGLVTTYANVSTTGWGTPAIYATGRSTAQTGAVTSVATYTVGAADGSFLVSGNVNVTAYTSGNFTLQVVYTSESGAVVTANMQGHFTSGYTTTISGLGSFESQPLHIRAQAGSVITIKTAGTFTSLTYNVEGTIVQIA